MDIHSIGRIKNVDGFNFVEALGSFINNYKFKQGFIQHQLEVQAAGQQTKNSYLWDALSSIGDEYGEVIYENVLNYLDNVGNVDLCNVKALQSMLQVVGIQYDILQTFNAIPVELARVLDLLSINSKYLLDNKTFKSEFIDMLSAHDCIKTSVLSGDELCAFTEQSLSSMTLSSNYVDESKYTEFLQDVYYTILTSFIYMQYADAENGLPTEHKCIYEYLQKEILGQQIQSDLAYNDANELCAMSLKTEYGISKSFNQQQIVDNIENGLDSLDNYDILQQKVLLYEINRREATYAYPKPYLSSATQAQYGMDLTRYSYYREKKVKEYFAFVENTYNNLNSEQGIKPAVEQNTQPFIIEPYEKDPNYFDINQVEKKQLLVYDESTDSVEVQHGYIVAIANLLAQQTIEIAHIRDQVKFQIRKSYMRGTMLLISYVINEFLKFNILNKYGKSFQTEDGVDLGTILAASLSDENNVQLIEYYDNTQYYNITQDVDVSAKYSSTVNEKFWDNAYSKIGQTTEDIPLEEIDYFYKTQLKLREKSVDDLVNFLSIIYEYGANNSFINKDTDQFNTLIPSRTIGGKPYYIGKPSNEIASLENSILSVKSIIDGIDTYVQRGFQDTAGTTEDQLSALSVFVNEYFFNEISSANASLEDEVNSYIDESTSTAEDISDKLAQTSAQYEQLKSNPKYEPYLTAYLEKRNAYFADKLQNFMLSVSSSSRVRWKNTAVIDSLNDVLDSYVALSNDTYSKLFALSVWGGGSSFECWPWYSPDYSSELTDVTNTLNDYLANQVQDQNAGAQQHLQNHYDKLLSYKNDLAQVLVDCKGAIAKYEAMRAGVEAVSMTSMSQNLSKSYVINVGPINKVVYVDNEYVLSGVTKYDGTTQVSFSSPAISNSDSIDVKLQKLQQRAQLRTYTRLCHGKFIPKSPLCPDENCEYFSNRTETNGHYVYHFDEVSGTWYDRDSYEMPWQGAFSQSTASEIIATLQNAVVQLNATVNMVNTDLQCLGSMFSPLKTYNSTADTINDDVARAYDELVARLDQLYSYVLAGNAQNGWISLTSDSNLMQYKNRLQLINQINLSAVQPYNIRYIDSEFEKISHALADVISKNALYFEDYVNDDTARIDQQVYAISTYAKAHDSQCSSDIISEVSSISSQYINELNEFDAFALMLRRNEVTSIADDYAYNLSTILYRNEIYSAISNVNQVSRISGETLSVRYKDYLDYLLSGDYINLEWPCKLSGAMYWIDDARTKFYNSALSSTYSKVPDLPAYQEMTSLIDIAMTQYAKRVESVSGLLIDKFEAVIDEINLDIAHVSSCIPLYEESHELYLKYNGTDIGYDPFYNHENQAYSSYQIHPYLYNFVEKLNVVYPLANSFFVAFGPEYDTDLYENGIDNILGKLGNVKDLWKSGMLDWTGYSSQYERKAGHNAQTNVANPLEGFTGLFYPPALSAYLYDTEKFLQDVQDNTSNSYYYHLNLPKNQRLKVYEQLLAYEWMVKNVATAQSTGQLSGEFDIYRYAEDCMGNQIFLLKSYKHLYAQHKDEPGYAPSYHEKRNTLGELWMRMKGNPIAFPAFDLRSGYEDISQYSIKEKPNTYTQDINEYVLSINTFFQNHESPIDPVNGSSLASDHSILSTAYLTRDSIYEYETNNELNANPMSPQKAQHLRCFYDFDMDVQKQAVLAVVPFYTGDKCTDLYFLKRQDGNVSNNIYLSAEYLRFADSSIVIGYLGKSQLFNFMSDQTYVNNFSNDIAVQNNTNANNINNPMMLVNGRSWKELKAHSSNDKNSSDDGSTYFYEFVGFTSHDIYKYAVFVRKMFDAQPGQQYATDIASPVQPFTFIKGIKSKNSPKLAIRYGGYLATYMPFYQTAESEDLMYDCYDWHTDPNQVLSASYVNASNVAIGNGNGEVTLGFLTKRFSVADFNSLSGADYTDNTKIVNFAEYTSQVESYNAISDYGMSLDYPRSTALIQTTDFQHINIYNSFDSFVQHIVNVTFKFSGQKLKYSHTDYFNLNSDIGYLPQYVGIPGTTKYCSNSALSGLKQLNIELLGPEKSDIAFTPVITNTNVEDKNGRVVEGYKDFNQMSAFNMSPIVIEQNEISTSYIFDLSSIYIQSISGFSGDLERATESWNELQDTTGLMNYKYLLYNTSYLAMPILKGNLSDALPNGYFYQSSELYDLLSGEEVIGPNQSTYQNINLTNHIDNISAISMEVEFDQSKYSLPSKLHMSVIARIVDSYNDRVMPDGTFFLLLYTTSNNTSYEDYHLFENANENLMLSSQSVDFDDCYSLDLAAYGNAEISSISVESGVYPFRRFPWPGDLSAPYSTLSAPLEFKYSEGDLISREFPYIDTVVSDDVQIVENDPQSTYFFAIDSWKSVDVGSFNMKTYDVVNHSTYNKKINGALPKYHDFYDRALMVEATYNVEKSNNSRYEIVQYFNYRNFTSPQYPSVSWPDDSSIPPSSYICDSTDPSIEHTYLVLKPGQSGRLDIRIDFVEYAKLKPTDISQSIVGQAQKTIATYYIMNVSDEKPKFVISRTPFSAMSQTTSSNSNYELA